MPSRVKPRGFSLRELGLTLLLLAVVIIGAVRLIDLRTKLLAVEKDEPLGIALEAARRALARDVAAAGRGGVAPGEAVRLVADNSAEDAGFADVSGARVVVRAGTDQLGLRGVMRAPLLAIRLVRGMGPDGASAGDRIPGDGSGVWVQASLLPAENGEGRADDIRAVAERLGARTPRAKRFFLVADREGRSAIALVREWKPLGDTGASLEIRLDFTDPEAASLNPRGAAGAALALGEPVAGGLLDDAVWFVARGSAGRPGDDAAGNDPPSMKFPHPYLAVAEFAGNGRWEITRVGEDVEEFQVAREPGALRVAWTAKAERRFKRGDGPPPPLESPPLLNAPAPDSARGTGPVGWDPDESRRVPFERSSMEFVLSLGDVESRAPLAAPPGVK